MGTNPDATTDKGIDWVKNKGGILEMHWHWDAPRLVTGDKWQAFYTKNTAFDVAAAMNDTTSEDYKLLVRDIDIVSERLLRMQNEGIALLWRPLHEAEGKWFWWGAKTGDACKKLYRMMYNRMVNYHKINNLIWVWNSYGTTKENWYPGDDVVDIIAWDYPDYSQSTGSWSQYQAMFGTKGKLFAIGEDGKLFNPDLFAQQPWLYFITWAYMIKDPSQANGKNTADWINRVYNDSRVITLDDLHPGPKAKAGSSQLLYDTDGNGMEMVQLDGSASKTDIGTITSYAWTENDIEIATGVAPAVNLPVGIHNIKLTITTSTGLSKSATVVITIKTPSISLKKPYVVSSTEASLGNIAANAVDGDPATRWSSTYTDPQWYQVDLGKKYDIKQVIISWEVASAKNYTIEISDDGLSWRTIMAKSNMPSGNRTDNLSGLSGTGRYIRMYGTARTTTWGYSIYEFEVYGSEPGFTGLTSTSQPRFKVFPTQLATSEKLQVICPPGLLPAQFQVYNQTGQLSIQGILTEKNSLVDLAGNLQAGMYLFRVQHQGYSQTEKFLIIN
jgi:Glycosyl hydrolase family 26/F5/8 type C domain